MKEVKLVFVAFIFLNFLFYPFLSQADIKKNSAINVVKYHFKKIKNKLFNKETTLHKSQSRLKLNKVQDIYENTIFIHEHYLKKKLLINLWATWCPPCIKELEDLSDLAKSYPDELLVIAISSEDKNTVKTFISKSFPDLNQELKFVILEKKIVKKYFSDQVAFPSTYLFNTKHELKEKVLGAQKWNNIKWKKHIKEML